MGIISLSCFIFALIAIFGFTNDEYIYLKQANTRACSKSSHNLSGVEHDHNFTRQQIDTKKMWKE